MDSCPSVGPALQGIRGWGGGGLYTRTETEGKRGFGLFFSEVYRGSRSHSEKRIYGESVSPLIGEKD